MMGVRYYHSRVGYLCLKRKDVLRMNKQEKVSAIMTQNLLTVNVEDDLHRVYDLMRKHNIRHLPVVQDKKLVGIISRNDILRLSFGDIFGGEEPADFGIFDLLTLEQVMASNPETVTPECTIAELGKLFVESNFHALPVVNDEGEAIGIVTTTDVIAYFLNVIE